MMEAPHPIHPPEKFQKIFWTGRTTRRYTPGSFQPGVLMAHPRLTFDILRVVNTERCVRGFGHTLDSWSVAEWGNAAAGECGEACNVAKKMLRFRDGVAGNKKSLEEYRADLASEIAGTLIYLDLWAASQGINLADAVRDEFNKKSQEIGSPITL